MKANNKFSSLLLILVAALLMACEDDMPEYYHEKDYALEDFNSIDLGDAFQVEIIRDQAFSVTAKGEDRDLDELELRVENNTLTGSYRHGSRSHKRTLIQVYMPELRTAHLHSATTSVIKGFHSEEDSLYLQLAGAAKLTSDTDWKLIELQVSGASELVLEGRANMVKGAVNGASNFNAADFSTEACDIAVGGASEAWVMVSDRLSGSVNGNSRLSYSGNPVVVEVEVASDSRIKAVGHRHTSKDFSGWKITERMPTLRPAVHSHSFPQAY